MIRCESGDLADTLGALSIPDAALIFVTRASMSDDWTAVRAELTEAFTLSQATARAGGAVVYILNGDDLLGRRGPGPAMVACGLLAAARTLALETARSGVPANVLAMGEGTTPEAAGFWVNALCRPGGPNGELIRLGGDHLGKALP